MYLTEAAMRALEHAAMEGMHTHDRASAALWGSIASLPRLEVLSDNHEHLLAIDEAHVEVRTSIDKAVEELHNAVRSIDRLIGMGDRFRHDELRREIDNERRHR